MFKQQMTEIVKTNSKEMTSTDTFKLFTTDGTDKKRKSTDTFKLFKQATTDGTDEKRKSTEQDTFESIYW